MLMKLSVPQRILFATLVTVFLFAQSVVVHADSNAPVVKLRYNNDIQPDGSWVLGVKATDDRGVSETTVFYRTRSQKEYTSVNSSPADGYRWLSHFVGYKPTTIYFYVESSDAAGNITSRGSTRKPMSVKVAPISKNKKKKSAPKASNTVVKKKDGSIDYGDDCKRASVWKRIGVNSSMTRKTVSRNGKKVPNGVSKRMSLSAGKYYFYSTWKNLKIRDYDFKTRLIDSNGRVAYQGKIKIKSTSVGGEHTWTTWDTYQPKKGDPTGLWRYVVCGDGRMQVNMKVSVVK